MKLERWCLYFGNESDIELNEKCGEWTPWEVAQRAVDELAAEVEKLKRELRRE